MQSSGSQTRLARIPDLPGVDRDCCRYSLLDSWSGRERPYLPDFWGNVGRHVNQMIQASQLVMQDFPRVATSVPSTMFKEV